MKQAFEQWYNTHYGHGTAGGVFSFAQRDDRYVDHVVELAWQAYKAGFEKGTWAR